MRDVRNDGTVWRSSAVLRSLGVAVLGALALFCCSAFSVHRWRDGGRSTCALWRGQRRLLSQGAATWAEEKREANGGRGLQRRAKARLAAGGISRERAAAARGFSTPATRRSVLAAGRAA